jgi:hypothetical protein
MMRFLPFMLCAVVLAACSSPSSNGEGEGEGSEGEGEGEGDEGEGEGDVGEGEGEGGEGEGEDLDVPPTTVAELEAWILSGRYLDWACEDAPHAPRAPSPHPSNRICNNALLANSSPDAAIPVGAASVKEIYDGDAISLYAVSVKLAEGGATDAAAYYWYEGDTTSAPIAAGNGAGGGFPQTVCFDCHSHGIDEGGQEQFFTIVR